MTEPSLEELDAAIRSQSYSAMGRDIELLDDLILHINHGTALLTGRQHDRGLKFLMGLLLNRAFNSLWRAREDAICGYSAECLTLCRSALEHWAAARWIELHPEASDRWLWAIFPEITMPSQRPPSTNQMLKELKALGEVPMIIYDVLSKFAHPKSKGLRWVIHFDSSSTYFHAGGHFDQHDLKVCLYYLIGVAQACLEPVARLQNNMIGKVDPAWLQRGEELSERAEIHWKSIQSGVLSKIAPLSK